MIEQLTLRAGDTWSWIEAPANYPNTIYNLDILLKTGIEDVETLSGTPEGSGFRFTVSAADSGAYTGGQYEYRMIATLPGEGEADDEVTTVAAGTIIILPGLADGDQRSQWEINLANLQSAIATWSEREGAEVQISGRMVRYKTWDELWTAYVRTQKMVLDEQRARTGRPLRRIFRTVFE